MMSSICAAPVNPDFFRSVKNFFEQMRVLLLLRGGVNQARIRRRVLRFEILDRFEVARVGNDLGKFLELFRAGLALFSSLQQQRYSWINSSPLWKPYAQTKDRQ